MRKLSEIEDWEIIEALGKAKNQVDVLRILDVNVSGGNKRIIRKFIKNHNINTDNFKKKLSKEQYEQIPKLCKKCGNPIPWENRFGEFCCKSCAISENNKSRKKTLNKTTENIEVKNIKYCKYCGKQLKSTQNKYCCPECQTKYHRKEYIDKWKQGLNNGLKGEYQLSKHIRNYLLEKNNYKCELCGWGETNLYTGTIPLEIHHKDGNYLNNSEDNLQVLCPNCHSLTETIKSHNKSGRKGRKKYYDNKE